MDPLFSSFRQQQTIAQVARVEGFGFWSGRDVTLEFRPSEPDSGITFIRGDLDFAPAIPARYPYRIDAPRRTVLQHRGARVEMVEHVLAALAGLRIDNCQVWTTAAEMPGLDGSSEPFVRALEEAGLVVQAAPRMALVVDAVVRVGDASHWIEARPGHGLQARYHLDYSGHRAIGRQMLHLQLDRPMFRRQLAAARTFILKSEADQLRAAGYARRVTPQDVLVFDQSGVIDNQLRFPDECVRHKMLDMVGDLALAGVDLIGQFEAYRSGHQLNASLVARLWELAERNPGPLRQAS
jgi:UDP-3-O-acyl N-acetylglucosamine deacetylase